MYKNKKILSLIAARGGSKGLPGKNIKPFLGKPLLVWSIEQAKESRYIDKVVVSTDNEQIASVSKDYGAEVPFIRPKALAKDGSSVFDVIIHALNFLKKKGEVFDILVLLECTSPMRYKNDIDNVIKTLVDNKNANSVAGVVGLTNEHPLWSLKVKDAYLARFVSAAYKLKSLNRQKIQKAYLSYSIYATWQENCERYRTFIQPNTVPYFLKREQKVDIDDDVDFYVAGCIVKKYLK